MKTILIVDGICPRGIAIMRHLSATGEYHILVFTKCTTCPEAVAVNTLPSVTLLLNRATTGYDLQTFAAGAQRCPNVLICSSVSNAVGKEGVQWGAQLVQTAINADVKHLVFATTSRDRIQCSLDSKSKSIRESLAGPRVLTLFPIDYLHSFRDSNMAWTIMRTPIPSDAKVTDERALSASQLQTLAQYVSMAFSQTSCAAGKDFVITDAQSPAKDSCEAKRRGSRVESGASTGTNDHIGGIKPHPDLKGGTRGRQAPSKSSTGTDRKTANSGTSRKTSPPQNVTSSQYLDSNRARAIQQWVTSTSSKARGKKPVVESSSGEEDDESSSGSESD